MVLSRKIRILAGFTFFLTLTICFSCEKTFPGLILCSDCQGSEPLMANLELKLSANRASTTSIIEIYEGNLEDSVLYMTYKTLSASTNFFVPINKKYTLVASYYITKKHYRVIDSVTPTAKYDDVQCEKECWYVTDKVVDLRLKRF